MTVRTSYDAVARAGTAPAARAQSRSTGSSASSNGGSSRWFDGQVREQRRERDAARRPRRRRPARRRRSRARGRRRRRGGRRSMGTPVNAVDDLGAGHVGERVGGHDHVVGDAEQQRRARHAGPTSDEHDRHHARRVGERLGDPAPGVERRDAFGDVGARTGDPPDDRHAELDREADRPARSSRPRRVPMAPRCLPPSRLNQLTVRPSISRTSAAAAVLRCP